MPGAVGDVVVWDGDPLEVGSVPTEVYIGGFPPGWRGLDVCKGQGTLDGVQMRLHIEHDSITFRTTFTGFVFVPGS